MLFGSHRGLNTPTLRVRVRVRVRARVMGAFAAGSGPSGLAKPRSWGIQVRMRSVQ